MNNTPNSLEHLIRGLPYFPEGCPKPILFATEAATSAGLVWPVLPSLRFIYSSCIVGGPVFLRKYIDTHAKASFFVISSYVVCTGWACLVEHDVDLI